MQFRAISRKDVLIVAIVGMISVLLWYERETDLKRRFAFIDYVDLQVIFQMTGMTCRSPANRNSNIC